MASTQEEKVARFGPTLEACYSDAEGAEVREACVGVMAEACMAADGGNYSTVAMMECISAETAVWDRFLNAEYRQTLASFEAMDAAETGPANARRVEALRTAQRAWIAFRDAECGLAYAVWGAGSMRMLDGAGCFKRMTAERTLELRAMREPFE